MNFDLYAWKSPRDLDAEDVQALISRWNEVGGDPTASTFVPSSDVGWFYRELMQDAPGIEALSDATQSQSRTPIWLSSPAAPPARVDAIRLSPTTPQKTLEAIFGLAAKYDLVLFDARSGRVHAPLAAMAAHASATFWPAGAVQAAVAGVIGATIAVLAWVIGIPILSGVLIVVGGFMFVMSVYTFVHEGRKRVRTRGSAGE